MRADVRVKLAMDSPAGIVRTKIGFQFAVLRMSRIELEVIRRLTDDEIETNVGWKRADAVAEKCLRTILETIATDCFFDRPDRFRIDVGEHELVAQSFGQERKTDETGAGTPF